MCRIPYTTRINGRYVYRRRVHFQKIISKPVSIALRTADPMMARMRAAMLSARFAMVKLRVEYMLSDNRDFLTGAEIEELFRRELEAELSKNLADAFSNASYSSSVGEAAGPLAEAYRIARKPDRPRCLSEADKLDLAKRGVSSSDFSQIDEYLAVFCHDDGVSDQEVRAHLAAISAPDSPALLEMARSHLLRARADAWRRTKHIFDDAVIDAPNPLQALLSLDAPPAAPKLQPAQATSSPAQPAECPFILQDPRRFSEIIDDVIARMKQDGAWKGDCSQQKRIMTTFAWITGDKALRDYTHMDVDHFKRGLQRLPVTFRFGTLTQGAMARPFAEVRDELPALVKGQERNPKTINRDLSTMSSIARHLALTLWKPTMPNSPVLDFAAASITIKDDGVDTRPPWKRIHLERLFQSPLYTGGGSAKNRLRESATPQIWHDAAYWAPLLWYYHSTCREEMCGLRIDEVVLDDDIPYFVIQDNDVRGRDGELAGEKRIARRRALPIHPQLLGLGFAAYVRAVQREGHVALFPELYINDVKRGGAQFYNIAWRFMVDWLTERMEVPRNKHGKGSDIHSIRALGSSFYEVDGINPIIRADIMGHARADTNGKHYSKRLETEGLAVVLKERLEFILRYVPVITNHLTASPIRLLPIEQRSRVGTGRARKVRCDAGVPKHVANAG